MSSPTAFLAPGRAQEPPTVQLAGAISFALHFALLAALATSPARLALSANVLSENDQQIEIEAIPAPTPDPEPDVHSDIDGGNGIPPAPRDAPAPEDPEPPIRPEPPGSISKETAPEGVVSVEERSSKSDLIESSDSDDSEATDVSPDAASKSSGGHGPPDGRGEGFGDGRGGAKPAPLVDFFPAFLKSLPLVGKDDPNWVSLPRGAVGRVTFRVTLNEGKLSRIEIVPQPEAPAPAVLRHMVTGAHDLLRERRFLFHPGQSSATRVFVLDASIDRRSPDDEEPDKAGVSQLGLLGVPLQNGAYFTYYSGHHVNLFMYQHAGR